MHGRIIYYDEETYNVKVNYLKERNLLSELDSYPKLNDGVVCGGTFNEYPINNRKREMEFHGNYSIGITRVPLYSF